MSSPPDGRPSLTQLAWVFDKLAQHLSEGGTFRQLVEKLGYGAEAYEILMAAGGVEIANALDWASTMEDIAMVDGLEQVEFIRMKDDDGDKDGEPN